MTIWETILLGVVQGLTEFLPVSSSGHLVLVQVLLDVEEADVFFDVVLHLGTLGSIGVVYRRDLLRMASAAVQLVGNPSRLRHPQRTLRDDEELRMMACVVVASVPTAIIGFLFRGQLESAFHRPALVGAMLLVTGTLLLLSGAILKSRRRRSADVHRQLEWWQAPLVGLAQGIAILPGISRSGATISTALLFGVEPAAAARFSFLLSVPAILGAALFKLVEAAEIVLEPAILLTGFLVSFTVGWAALAFLLSMLRRGRFGVFAWYCFALGGITILLALS